MWGTAAWNWGSAVGDAHDAAAELRSALSTNDSRRDYLPRCALTARGVGETVLRRRSAGSALAEKIQRRLLETRLAARARYLAAQTPRKGKEEPGAASVHPHVVLEAACAQDRGRGARARKQP